MPFTLSLLGIVTIDVVVGMLGLVVWCRLLRDALIDSPPGFIRERFPARDPYRRRQWFLAPAAVIAGSLTHVGWDEFTHEGRWGAQHVAWLRETHLGAAGYHWAQAVSGVLGLMVVVASLALTVARGERRPRRAVVPQLAGRASWAVAGIAAVTGLVTLVVHSHDGLHAMAFASAVASVSVLAVAAVVAAAGWRVLAQRER